MFTLVKQVLSSRSNNIRILQEQQQNKISDLNNNPSSTTPIINTDSKNVNSRYEIPEILKNMMIINDEEQSVGKMMTTLNEINKDAPKELSFYLRYFEREGTLPSTSNVFRMPQSEEDEGYEVTYAYAEYFQAMRAKNVWRKAWRAMVETKFSDMTACGHYSDTLFWTIFFESKKKAINAIKMTMGDRPLGTRCEGDEMMRMLRTLLIKNPEKSYVIRLENDGHVMTMEFPARCSNSDRTGEIKGYLIQSNLNQCEWSVQKVGLDAVCYHYNCYVVQIAEFEEDKAVKRLFNAISKCFSENELNSLITFYKTSLSWNDFLDVLTSFSNEAIDSNQSYQYYTKAAKLILKKVSNL